MKDFNQSQKSFLFGLIKKEMQNSENFESFCYQR